MRLNLAQTPEFGDGPRLVPPAPVDPMPATAPVDPMPIPQQPLVNPPTPPQPQSTPSIDPMAMYRRKKKNMAETGGMPGPLKKRMWKKTTPPEPPPPPIKKV
jgi:hypothetical protein